MKAAIKKQNMDDEFYTPEKCYITELSNTPDDPDVSIARARVESGVTTRWHRLKETTEHYYIINGKGYMEVEELTQEVSAGDVVIIPPMCRQRITNIGSDDLIILAICTPRFQDNAYEDIEENPV